MRITGLQLDIAWEAKVQNQTRIEGIIGSAGADDLLVLPEMFSTGFTMNSAAAAEQEGGATEQWLSSLARKLGCAVMGGNVRESTDGRCFNESLTYTSDGMLACRYQKIHPFSLGEEDKHYAAGTEVKSFALGNAVIAPFICYDLRFPEAFRLASKSGANLIAVIANWPSKRIQHWVTLLQARAIENLAYVIGVNRTGKDPHLEYTGRSVIVDYMGEIIADAGSDEGLISADLNFEELNRWRDSFPALRDRKL
ncbi:MAG: carbon-nitrogen family hydrolase [Verrucomicrobiales bacterium]